MIFESHAHYDDEAFSEDCEAVLTSLKEQKIDKVVNVGSSLATSYSSIQLAKKHSFIYAAVGVHPSETEELNENNFEELRKMAHEDKTVAIGEIGLDYYWPEPNRDLQKVWFKRQLQLATEVELPVIIHSRDAAKDTMDILRTLEKGQLTGVMHCFSYSEEIAEEILKMGWYVGIGGVITFRNARKLREVVERIPLERILTETDCPYLAPVPHRGERNYSGYLPLIISEIAKIKGITEQETESITHQNAMDLFRIRINE